jgi:hypothetical protein
MICLLTLSSLEQQPWPWRISDTDVAKFIAYFRKFAGSQQYVDREGFRKIIAGSNVISDIIMSSKSAKVMHH